jgi:hypothetical protein
MKTTFAIFLCSTSLSFAQTEVTIQGGIGARTPIISLQHYNSTEDSWKSPDPINIGIEHFVTRSIAIISSLEYNYYAFESYHGLLPDHATSVNSGDPTRIYRISIEGKFSAPPVRNFSIYLITGTCYTIDREGSIYLGSWDPNVSYIIPSQAKYYWMQTFGLGWRYRFLDSFGIDMTGKLYTDYSAHFHESLMLGFFYTL